MTKNATSIAGVADAGGERDEDAGSDRADEQHTPLAAPVDGAPRDVERRQPAETEHRDERADRGRGEGQVVLDEDTERRDPLLGEGDGRLDDDRGDDDAPRRDDPASGSSLRPAITRRSGRSRAALPAEEAGLRHAHEPRRRREARLAERLPEHLADVDVDVDPDQVDQRERANRPVRPEPHALVDVLGARGALVEHAHRVVRARGSGSD